MEARTSETHPIEVGWLVAGRLGLTFAPGKNATSKFGFPWARSLRADLTRLRDELGANVLVSLIEDHELRTLGIPDLVSEARNHGFDVLRFPIVDYTAPSDAADTRRLVDGIVERLDLGDRVIIHCRGGLGRAGTIGGCTLLALGEPIEQVFQTLVAARGPSCPEKEEQREFVRAFGRALAEHPLERPSQLALGSIHSEIESAFVGATLGAAIGDAMGHPTEFVGSMDKLRARFGPRGVEGYALYWERDGQRFAPFTDDTQMAEAVMRALVGALAAEDSDTGLMARMARGFVSWAFQPRGGHRAPGNACLRGCYQLDLGAAWDRAGAPDAGGCGSVMRAFPFGLAYYDDLARAESLAVQHSLLTHGDPIAKAACAAMAVGVAACVVKRPVSEVLSLMERAAARYSSETGEMIAAARSAAELGTAPEQVFERYLGWAAHDAIAAATFILARHPEDVRAAILEGANTPGDSDSIATLAGALVGARVGSRALPGDWVSDLERRAELEQLALALARARQAGASAR